MHKKITMDGSNLQNIVQKIVDKKYPGEKVSHVSLFIDPNKVIESDNDSQIILSNVENIEIGLETESNESN